MGVKKCVKECRRKEVFSTVVVEKCNHEYFFPSSSQSLIAEGSRRFLSES